MRDEFDIAFPSGSNLGEQIVLTQSTYNKLHTVRAGPKGTYEEVYLWIGGTSTTAGVDVSVVLGARPTTTTAWNAKTDVIGLVLVVPGVRLGPGKSVYVNPGANDVVAVLVINRREPMP